MRRARTTLRTLAAAGLLVSMASPPAAADTTALTNPANETPSVKEFHKGRAALATGDLKQAEEALKASLRHDPKNIDAYLASAELAVRRQDPGKAATLLTTAKKLASQDARVHLAWGRYHLRKKLYQEAESAFSKSVSLDPGSLDALMALGDLRAKELKKPKEAAEAYRAAIKAAPTFWRARYGLALQQAQLGALDEAHKELAEAGKLSPTNHLPPYTNGVLYLQEKHYETALSAFNEALERRSDYVPALLARADLYRLGTRQIEKAVENYRAALTHDPKGGRAHLGLGLALKETGTEREALEHLEAASRLMPRSPEPWQELGELYARQKQYEAARKAFETARRADSKSVQALVGSGDIDLAQGRYQSSIARYADALRLNPQSPLLHVKLGVAHARHRQWRAAEQMFKKATELNPKTAEAWNNLAWIEIERKENLDDAVGWAQKAVDLEPARAANHDTLGWAYRARGELTRAAASLKRAAELDPKDPVIHYHRGVVYGEQQKLGEAREALQHALSLDQTFEGAADARQRLSSLSRAASG